jgi:predicted DNA-binding protein (UPF0251 family)
MDKGVLAARTQLASEKLFAAAASLAKRFDMADEADALKTADRHVRNQDAKTLYRLEAMADFFDRMAGKTSPSEIPSPVEITAAHTVAELRDIINLADADQLDRIEAAEKGDKNRKTVFEAIDKRRVELVEALPNEAPE